MFYPASRRNIAEILVMPTAPPPPPPPRPHPPPVYQNLRTRHDWPLKKAIVDLPIRLKGDSKRTSGNSLSLLGSQKTDLDATSQTLLTEVKLRLPHAQANLLSGQDKPS